ncbi:MAG TPA: hypothetical protein VNM90_18495, partial [Haliangium sp.]|nr:hypothetical protein [Haliangium sp.]
MKIEKDRAYEAFSNADEEPGWGGVRIKGIRARPLSLGGRARLTLFEAVNGSGRPHPRMQVDMPPATDPSPPGELFAPAAEPRTSDELREQIRTALAAHRGVLSADDLDLAAAPAGSAHYWQNSIRTQRLARFFEQVHARMDEWRLDGELARDAQRVIRELEDEAHAIDMELDDQDIGTYYSYRHDMPFVHYLELIQDTLPRAGTEAFAVLPAEAQRAVLRQHEQIQSHLDYLMRHKYAYQGITETDIERSLGGLLIDEDSRHIVSEIWDPDSLVPRYELLRVAPAAAHEHAGAWVYRDGKDRIYLQDGTQIEVAPDLLSSSPRTPEQLTFQRGPRDPRLRRGIRFDWDDSGWVQAGKIDWVSWAGHCDVQAVLEQLGIVLDDQRPLVEYRSDSGVTITYDRDLLLEMLASVMELGSLYVRIDGKGFVWRGVRHFGGARNDELPDRLQLQGMQRGRHFHWPPNTREEAFRVTSIAWPDESGSLQKVDMGTVFCRDLPDLENLDFHPNPRFVRTVEGDDNVIDVSGALITAEILVDDIDKDTGYPRQNRVLTTIDLRSRPEMMRCFLGTRIDDVASRRLSRFHLDRERDRIVAEPIVYERRDGKWRPRSAGAEQVVLSLATPLGCTLSREMGRDDPEMYQVLLGVALRTGQNICADTDWESPVWNGVVTRLEVRKTGENRARRTERWSVDIHARFGRARMDYLLRRDEVGEPVAYCPVVSEDTLATWPDFLWQDFPDVGTKGLDGSNWIVNRAMLERGIISLHEDPSVPGGFYVYDDHMKNVFEILFTALAGYRYSIVHGNKRHGFETEAVWKTWVSELKRRRAALTFRADT